MHCSARKTSVTISNEDPFIDILPLAKTRGFQESLLGFPASRRLAGFGFHRTRSYSLSTGFKYRESHGMYVLCSVDITIMGDAALRASPEPNIKHKGVEHMTTSETALRGRIPLVNLDQGTPIPLGFVCELPYELTPSHIANRFCE